MYIEKSSGNDYADLDRADADNMLVKARLVAKIGEMINDRKWNRQQAAQVLGLNRYKLSQMLRGQFCAMGQSEILECLARFDSDLTSTLTARQ